MEILKNGLALAPIFMRFSSNGKNLDKDESLTSNWPRRIVYQQSEICNGLNCAARSYINVWWPQMLFTRFIPVDFC